MRLSRQSGAEARRQADEVVRLSGFQRVFFLYVEPVCALAGFVWAAFLPSEYMRMMGSRAAVDAPTRSVLLSLANLVRAANDQC